MVKPTSIALWSHPRSMSTSVERSFRERGDCQCHHEPFMYYHYLVKTGAPYPGFDHEDDRPRELMDIAAMVTAPPHTSPQNSPHASSHSSHKGQTGDHDYVFFKDMSYYIADELDQLMPIMRQITSVFLIRDPRLSIASYAKLDDHFSCEEVGIADQWRHYCALAEAGLPLLVVDAHQIAANPSQVMGQIWDFCGMPFKPEALSWPAGALPSDWEQAKTWHASSLNSTGFAPPDQRDPDAVFAEAAKRLPHLREYLDHHWPYYERLKAISIKVDML